MTLKAINTGVLFTFVDATNNKGEFEKGATSSGIILKTNFDESARQARFAKVHYVGPEVTSVKPGDTILIPALRWTEGVSTPEGKRWKTDVKEIAAVVDGDVLKPLNTHVLFTLTKQSEEISSSGIVLVTKQSNDSQSGVTIAVEDGGTTALIGRKFYFNDPNFFNTITFKDREVSFIKEDEILAFEGE